MSSVSTRLERWMETMTEAPASTRVVGIMRIGIALVSFAELGDKVVPRHEPLDRLGIFFLAATALMLVGLWSQAATFAASTAMWLAITKVPGTMHHHTYLMAVATTCLSLTPCGRSLSLDRLLVLRAARAKGAPAPEEHGNLWALRLICLQLTAVMFWGGYNKLTLGTQSLQIAFLSGDRVEQTFVFFHSLPSHPPNWLSTGFALAGSSVTFFELFCGIGFWLPQTRKWCVLGCLVMTTSFQLLLSVGTFGFLAAVLYLSFVPPDRVHRITDVLLAWRGGARRASSRDASEKA